MNLCPRSYHDRALEGIKDKLQSVLEKISAVGYEENDADAHAVEELAEDARDAIIEYQVSSNLLATVRVHR